MKNILNNSKKNKRILNKIEGKYPKSTRKRIEISHSSSWILSQGLPKVELL
jgi:hypothetical protein